MSDSPYGTPARAGADSPGLPPTAAAGLTDPEVEGCLGVVTIRIPGGDEPGEVRIFARGAYEQHIAYSPESLKVGDQVRVNRSRGARSLDVIPVSPDA
jgi:hypothetical protein